MNALTKRRLALSVALSITLVVGGFILMKALDTEAIDSFNRCAEDGNPVTETDPPTCNDGHRYYVGPAATPAPVPESWSSQAFQVMVDGDSGGNFPRMSAVIDTEADWQAFWRAVHAGQKSLPPILPVNFKTDSIVVISEGAKQTDNYVYKISGIRVGDKSTIIEVRESIPTVTCKVKNIQTNRYHIVRTDKLTVPAAFRTTTEYRKCL